MLIDTPFHRRLGGFAALSRLSLVSTIKGLTRGKLETGAAIDHRNGAGSYAVGRSKMRPMDCCPAYLEPERL